MSFRVIKMGELTKNIHRPHWTIDGVLVEESLAMLYGESGSYASFLALDWALSIATGTPWQGHQVRQSPVLYLSSDKRSGVSKRTKAWEEARGIALEDHPFYVDTPAAQMLDPDSADRVRSIMQNLRREHGKPVALFIDTLNRNFGPGDENSTADIIRFIDTLKWVAGDDALRVVLHHTGRNSNLHPRGSSYLTVAVDTAYRIEKDNEGAGMKAFLFQTKMRDVRGWNHALMLELDRFPVIADDNGIEFSLAFTSGTPVRLV